LELRTFNQLKILILKTVRDHPNCTSKDVADAIGTTIDNAQVCLFRAYRQKLVERTIAPHGFSKPSYEYGITSRGVERIARLEKA